LSDAKVYEPYIRARLGTASHFCEVVVLTFTGCVQEEGGHGEGRKARDTSSEPEADDSDGALTGALFASLSLLLSSLLSLYYARLELSDTKVYET